MKTLLDDAMDSQEHVLDPAPQVVVAAVERVDVLPRPVQAARRDPRRERAGQLRAAGVRDGRPGALLGPAGDDWRRGGGL